jgi:ribosomal protein S18 acetylase RimI-like enzyme
MKIGLRPANAADTPFLQRVFRSTREPELARLPWTDAQKEQFCAMQFAAQDRGYRAAHPAAEFLIVLCGDDEAGRLYRAGTADALHILDIALLPPWRNRGVGTHLLRETMARAAARGVPLAMHVAKDNPARRLYARLGFVECADDGVYVRLERRAPAGGGTTGGG